AMGFIQTGAPIGSSSALFLGGLLLTGLTAGTLAGWLPQGWSAWQVVFIAAGLPGFLVGVLVLTLQEPPRRERAIESEGSAKGSVLVLLKAQPATFSVLYGLYACLFIIGYGIPSWAPTMLMRVYGLRPSAAGAVYATLLLTCSVSGYVISGFLSDALRKRRPLDGRILIPGLLLPIELVAMTAFGFSDHLWLTVAMIGLSSVINTLTSSTAMAVLQDIAPNQMRGQVI